MVKVSIIIPVYNSEPYLATCIKSVTGQTLKNIEIIIVNDGSLDSSLAICEKFKEQDERIKLFSIPNSGSAAARNIGLENAIGEYIGFVDSDDWVREEMFEELYDVAQKEDVDIVGCNFIRYYSGKEFKNIIPYHRSGRYSKKDLVDEFFPYMIANENLGKVAPVTMVTKIFRRELIESKGIRFDERLLGGQDIAFSSSGIIHSRSLYLMNEAYFYYYRYNPRSRTNTYMPNAWEVSKSYRDYFQNLLANYDGYDFSRQISLHKLSGALTAINYETKQGNPKNLLQKYRTVKQICNDTSGDQAFALVRYEELSSRRRVGLFFLKRGWSLGLLFLGYFNQIFLRIRNVVLCEEARVDEL